MPANIARKPRGGALMREVAYERFKLHLFKRHLVPGQFVSQGDLCELLDVPLGPTREALKRLEAEGLVKLIPQRGVQIADIGVALIHDAFDFRRIIECAAVRRYAVEATDGAIAELERETTEVLARFAGGGNDDPRLIDMALRVDWGMHNRMVEAMGNSITMSAHQQNFDKIRMIRLHGRSPRYLPMALEEHLNVIAAVKARDPERAAAALDEHLKGAERRALGL